MHPTEAAAAPLPPMLTEGAVSIALGVSPRTLQRWRAAGIGPHFIRLGARLVRYAQPDIEGWQAQQRRLGAA